MASPRAEPPPSKQDGQDATALLECLQIGVAPATLGRCKETAPPLNSLIDIGTDKNPKAVVRSHVLQYKKRVLA
eukprot:6232042-Alexandrium_andersonii.AAC.1